MLAIILAGGTGTRLRPFTMTIPKPLLPLGNMPILEVVVRQLAQAGVKRIVMTLGYMGHLLQATFGDGRRWGVDLEYLLEEKPLGTAGAIRRVQDLEDDFLVMNGDILSTIDYKALFTAHRRRRAWGTIAMASREVKVGFGVVLADGNGLLREYQEKPTFQYRVSMGINVLSRRCVDLIPPSQRFDMPELMRNIRQSGQKVFCYSTDCYWRDIGIFQDYKQASADFVKDPSRFLPNGAGRCR